MVIKAIDYNELIHSYGAESLIFNVWRTLYPKANEHHSH